MFWSLSVEFLALELWILFNDLCHIQFVLSFLSFLPLFIACNDGKTELSSVQNTLLSLVLLTLANSLVSLHWGILRAREKVLKFQFWVLLLGQYRRLLVVNIAATQLYFFEFFALTFIIVTETTLPEKRGRTAHFRQVVLTSVKVLVSRSSDVGLADRVQFLPF